MPQMSPMLWISMYVYFIMMFILSMILLYYMFIYLNKNNIYYNMIINLYKIKKW